MSAEVLCSVDAGLCVGGGGRRAQVGGREGERSQVGCD